MKVLLNYTQSAVGLECNERFVDQGEEGLEHGFHTPRPSLALPISPRLGWRAL